MKNYIIVIAIIVLLVLALRYRRRIRRFFNLLMSKYEYFTYEEFDSSGEPGSGKKYMNRTFIRRLDRAREKAGVPFVIISGYRTPSHNEEVGGSSDSAHIEGLAADIDYSSEQEKLKILKALVDVGFTRFGIRTGASGSSIHVDQDETKPQFAVWGYEGVLPGVDPFNLA